MAAARAHEYLRQRTDTITDTPSKVPLPSSPPQVLPVADTPQREASSPSIPATPPTFQANTGDRPASPTDSLDPTTSIFVRSPPPNQQSPFGRQVINNGSFPVLIMTDTLLDGGPFTTWTTIIWDRAWGFPIFRSRLYNIVHDALEKFIDVDVDYPMMSKHFYQCKITDRAHVTKLDEITSTNYNAVFAMMGAMIGLHCLKFEVNHTIDERPGSPGLGMLYVPTEQRRDRGYAGA